MRLAEVCTMLGAFCGSGCVNLGVSAPSARNFVYNSTFWRLRRRILYKFNVSAHSVPNFVRISVGAFGAKFCLSFQASAPCANYNVSTHSAQNCIQISAFQRLRRRILCKSYRLVAKGAETLKKYASVHWRRYVLLSPRKLDRNTKLAQGGPSTEGGFFLTEGWARTWTQRSGK